MQTARQHGFPSERCLHSRNRLVRSGEHAGRGALIAAIDMSSSTKRETSSDGAITTSIAPRGNAEISWPRRAMSVSASSSVMTPDKAAATYSPTL